MGLIQKTRKIMAFFIFIFVLVSFLCYFKDIAIFANKGRTADSLNIRECQYKNYATAAFYNSQNEITLASDKGYALVCKTLDEDRRVVCELYYDQYLQPIKQSLGHFGIMMDYYPDGMISTVTYVDSKGNPIVNSLGYVRCSRVYDHQLIIQEMYYDKNNEPTKLALGQCGLAFKYNQDGKKSEITYIDVNGNPIINSLGYVTLQCVYYKDGTIHFEWYLDQNGEKVLINGRYGIKHIGNMQFSVNKDGTVQLSIDNIVNNLPWIVILLGLGLCICVVFLKRWTQKCFIYLYLIFIICMTVVLRKNGGGAETELFWSYKRFFSSYKLRFEILNNIWLFIPLGASLYTVHKRKLVTIFPIIVSILIEISQFVFKVGLFEFDDVVSNSLGGFIGMAIALLLMKSEKLQDYKN